MRRVLRPARQRDEEGFSLVELLVGISVLGVIMVALTALMLGAMSANGQTKTRLDETRDEQFAAAYFSVDAQAATSVATSGAARCGTGSVVVELRGTSYEPRTLQSRVTVVSYVFRSRSSGGRVLGELQRHACEAPADPPPSYPLEPVSSDVVARTLAAAAPTVTCIPAPCTTDFRSVVLRATHFSDGAPFQLVGTRRTSP